MSRRMRPTRIGRRTKADAVEAAIAGADRSAHLLGVTAFADLIGRDRGTVAAWIEKGCPVAKRGGSGEKTLLDPARVFAWREEFARAEEAKRFAKPDAVDEGGDYHTPADRLKLAQLDIARQKLAQGAGILVHREPLQVAYAKALGLVRQSVMSVPERITREMAGFPEAKVAEWRLAALGQCRSALQEGAKALNDALLRMAEDMDEVEAGVEEDDEA